MLIKDYASISRDLRKAQQTQAALLKQKAALDARGAELSGRQQGLNAETETHNSVAVQQQKDLDTAKTRCNNGGLVDGKDTPQHVDDCGNAAKKLNKITLQVNAGVKPLQSRQTQLDLEFGLYNQAANDWTVQEQQTMTSLNTLYRALNSWADRADNLMGSAPFQEEMEMNHADQACAHRALPDGMLSIEELQRYAADADRCLKYVAGERKLARP